MLILSLCMVIFLMILNKPTEARLQRRSAALCNPKRATASFGIDCSTMLSQYRIFLDEESTNSKWPFSFRDWNGDGKWHAIPFPPNVQERRRSIYRRRCGFDFAMLRDEVEVPQSTFNQVFLRVALTIARECLSRGHAGGSLNQLAWSDQYEMDYHATLYEIGDEDDRVDPWAFNEYYQAWVLPSGEELPQELDESVPLLPAGPIPNSNGSLSPENPSALEPASTWDSEHRIEIPPDTTQSPSGDTGQAALSIDNTALSNGNKSRACLALVKRVCCGFSRNTLISTLVGCLATYGLTKHAGTVQLAELCNQAADAGFRLASCST